jgi:hypothetical protein
MPKLINDKITGDTIQTVMNKIVIVMDVAAPEYAKNRS